MCKICGNTNNETYAYMDDTHGFSKCTNLCYQCLYAHVKKWWPGSQNQKFLEQRFPQLLNTPVAEMQGQLNLFA